MARSQILVHRGGGGGGGGRKNKDFKAVSQTDLTRVEFRLWRKLASG